MIIAAKVGNVFFAYTSSVFVYLRNSSKQIIYFKSPNQNSHDYKGILWLSLKHEQAGLKPISEAI